MKQVITYIAKDGTSFDYKNHYERYESFLDSIDCELDKLEADRSNLKAVRTSLLMVATMRLDPKAIWEALEDPNVDLTSYRDYLLTLDDMHAAPLLLAVSKLM